MISRFHDFCRYCKGINLGLALLFLVAALTFLGLVVLASASLSFSQDTRAIFNKQLLWLFIACMAGFVTFSLNLEKLRKFSMFIGIGTLVLLILVLIPGLGVRVNGAQRWLGAGFARFQVSEFAKITLLFVLANYLSDNQRLIKTFFHGFFIPSVMIGVVCFLIILEPDFGTTFLCGCVGYGMLFIAGVRLRYLLPSLMGGVGLFFIAVLLNPVRLRRLTSFLDMEGNKADGAYQLWQGILAFAAGGVEGVGLGNGRQQMAFLPEAHTDFIFPIIGEELGLYFTLGVACIFLIIFIIGYMILRRIPDLFYLSLVVGSLLCIVFQALINIGVVTGLLPTKGMSLPFISYGGSNLIVMFMLVGVLLNALKTWSARPLASPSEL